MQISIPSKYISPNELLFPYHFQYHSGLTLLEGGSCNMFCLFVYFLINNWVSSKNYPLLSKKRTKNNGKCNNGSENITRIEIIYQYRPMYLLRYEFKNTGMANAKYFENPSFYCFGFFRSTNLVYHRESELL